MHELTGLLITLPSSKSRSGEGAKVWTDPSALNTAIVSDGTHIGRAMPVDSG